MEKLTLTVKEAAEELNMCVTTFYRLMNRAEHPVPTMKIGVRGEKTNKAKRLISVDALKQWIAEETEMEMKERG